MTLMQFARRVVKVLIQLQEKWRNLDSRRKALRVKFRESTVATQELRKEIKKLLRQSNRSLKELRGVLFGSDMMDQAVNYLSYVYRDLADAKAELSSVDSDLRSADQYIRGRKQLPLPKKPRRKAEPLDYSPEPDYHDGVSGGPRRAYLDPNRTF